MAVSDLGSIEATLTDHLASLASSRGQENVSVARTDLLIERGIFDSLSLLDFVVFTEKLCGIKIPGEDVNPENFGSVEAIMLYLKERL